MKPILMNSQTHSNLEAWKLLVLTTCLLLLPSSTFGQFVQDEFVLGAYMIPELTGDPVDDLPKFQQIRDANFNLVMYPGETEAAETFYTNYNAYILDLAAQTNLQALGYDENTYTIDAGDDDDVSAFNQKEANATSNFYLGLSQAQQDALYGFYLKDEPPHPDLFPSQLTHIRSWTEHFRNTLPG